jgi:hypothetical protein
LRRGWGLELLSMTWFRWLGITLISSQHLPSFYLLPRSSKSLPSASSKLSLRLFFSSNQQASPFQARLIVFICITVVARHHCDEAAFNPVVVAPDRCSLLTNLPTTTSGGHLRKCSEEREPAGIWRQGGLLLSWSAARTEFITGLDVQFCGFDGFRWGSLD